MQFTLQLLWGFLFLLVYSNGENEGKVTFMLFDNGASDGGVEMSLSSTDFFNIVTTESSSSTEEEEEAVDPNEVFAIEMSKYIHVSKFGQEPGTVVATKAFREDGEKITQFDQLQPSGNDKRRVYLVADGLQFVWPFVSLGHQQTLSTNVIAPVTPEGLPVVLESLSETPRVFKVHNLFTPDESNKLVDNALNLTGDKALKRSTVGSRKNAGKGDEVFDRTSENAWDHSSPTAKSVISRTFNLTGIIEDAGQIDGLQVVRYQKGQGYNTHPDFFQSTDVEDDFNFLPYSGGSNRFATVFMYLSNVEEGGSTVFPYTPPLAEPKPIPEHALGMFQQDSWEYRLNNECHSKLSVEPQIGTAALFYSVRPNGEIDMKSYHGACPVTQGEKWGANIWIWNKQRYGAMKQGDPRILYIHNDRVGENVYITWEGKPSGTLKPGAHINMNTYEFHRFKAHLGSYDSKEEALDEFTVQSQPYEQVWSIPPPRRKAPRRDTEEETENRTTTPSNTDQRTLIIQNLLQETVYISWEGMEGGALPAGNAFQVNTFQSHFFEAKLDSFQSALVISRYVVRTSPDIQQWDIHLTDDGYYNKGNVVETEEKEGSMMYVDEL